MEASPYAKLKEQLSSVPARELNISSRQILANNLDVQQVLSSKNGFLRDYRGLAELMGFQYNLIKKFGDSENPTMKILDLWETQQDTTLDKLIMYLEEMERYDVINEVKTLLEKNAESYISRIRLKETPVQVPEVTSFSDIVPTAPLDRNVVNDNKEVMITCDDIETGKRTLYDAYVSYADADWEYVARMADYLENQIGFKLFIHGRDMLLGCADLDAKIEMIKNRCRHMLIILTPNFLNSPACEFQVSFAGSLAIETKENILIPVIAGDCPIPIILKSVSKIDLTKPYIVDWMWKKLIDSLSRDHPLFSQPGELPMPLPSPPTSNLPVITYPQTTQMSTLSIENNTSSAALAITSGESSENDPENLSPSPKTSPSTRKNSFIQFWKKKGHSSRSPPISYSSGTSSGFYSQTRDDLGNVSESDVNNDEDDTSL